MTVTGISSTGGYFNGVTTGGYFNGVTTGGYFHPLGHRGLKS